MQMERILGSLAISGRHRIGILSEFKDIIVYHYI